MLVLNLFYAKECFHANSIHVNISNHFFFLFWNAKNQDKSIYVKLFFIQKNWELVGKKLVQLAVGVLNRCAFPKGLNETSLVLISKVENPHSVTQLQVIDLCIVAYKEISKAIVNQLKPILDKLVAPMQSSFALGRQIYDTIIKVYEMPCAMRGKQQKVGYMAIKIDPVKACNRIRLAFLRETLMDI